MFYSHSHIKPYRVFLLTDVDNEEFNKQFWNRLQDEWKKMSEKMDEQSSWLADFNEYYDPYRVCKINNSSNSIKITIFIVFHNVLGVFI